MKEQPEKYQIGESTMWLGEGNIVHFIAVGGLNDEHADEIRALNEKFLSMTSGPLHALADMNKTGRSTPYARKMWKKLSDQERSGKVGLFGLNPVARVVASFIVGRTKRNNVRFFKTKEDALLWLKE